MKYENCIGQKITSYSGGKGIFEGVKNNDIVIMMEGEINPRNYMFDPFFDGIFKFDDEKYQKAVDEEIAEYKRQCEEKIKESLAKTKDEETFYVTMDNADGSKEVIYSLNCEIGAARSAFGYVIREQQKVYRKNSTGRNWRVVRLFDSKTGKQIAQES